MPGDMPRFLADHAVVNSIPIVKTPCKRPRSDELRGRNITVNAIAPDPTVIDLFLNGKPQEVVGPPSQASTLERLGRPFLRLSASQCRASTAYRTEVRKSMRLANAPV